MRPNHIALVTGDQQAVNALVHEHVEVVKPEIGHHFFNLPLAVDGAQKLRLRQFPSNDARRIIHGEQDFFLLRRQAGKKLLAFPST